MKLDIVENPSHLSLFLIRQINLPGRPVLLQSARFSGPWNSNHALSSNPCKRNLSQCAAFPSCKLLDLLDDRSILIEVFPLKLWN